MCVAGAVRITERNASGCAASVGEHDARAEAVREHVQRRLAPGARIELAAQLGGRGVEVHEEVVGGVGVARSRRRSGPSRAGRRRGS